MLKQEKKKIKKKIPRGLKPIKGKTPFRKYTHFLGSVVTPSNHGAFRANQITYFEERYIADGVAEREKIKAQEDKTPEEIEMEVEAFNEKRPDEVELRNMAIRFARKMVTREHKHWKAFLAGKSHYFYNGEKYPVMTEGLIEETQSIQELLAQLKQYDADKLNTAGGVQSEDGAIQDSIEGGTNLPEGEHETLRHNAGDREGEQEQRSIGGTEDEPITMLPDSGDSE